jgi:hypothetical protein
MAVTTEVPKFPVLRMWRPRRDERQISGRPRLQLADGSFLDVPTIGEWIVTMGEDSYPVLTLRIPVELEVDAE